MEEKSLLPAEKESGLDTSTTCLIQSIVIYPTLRTSKGRTSCRG